MQLRPRFQLNYDTTTSRGMRRYSRAEKRAFRYHRTHPLDGDDAYRYRVTMLLPIGAVIVDQCGLRWAHISEKWWLSENGDESKGYMLRFPVLVVGMADDIDSLTPTVVRR